MTLLSDGNLARRFLMHLKSEVLSVPSNPSSFAATLMQIIGELMTRDDEYFFLEVIVQKLHKQNIQTISSECVRANATVEETEDAVAMYISDYCEDEIINGAVAKFMRDHFINYEEGIVILEYNSGPEKYVYYSLSENSQPKLFSDEEWGSAGRCFQALNKGGL